MAIAEALAVFAGLITTAIVYFKWKFSYWRKKGVPTLKPSIPFGNAADAFLQRKTLGAKLKCVYDELKPQGHKYAGFYMATNPIFLPFDLDLVKSMLTRDFAHFTDHSNYLNEDVDPMTGHLFFLKGLKWKNMRAKLSPAFTSGKMKMMFQILVDCSKELVQVTDKLAKEGEEFEIKELLARFTTDIIGSCAFGLECNSLKDPDAEFRKYGKKIFQFNFRDVWVNLLSITFPKVLDRFRIPLTKPEVAKFFGDVVKSTVNYREINNVIRKDFMHILIQLKNNIEITEGDEVGELKSAVTGQAGKTLSMNELIAQSFGFFVAGYETSSTTLSFCFYELATNPEIQEKLREEIKMVSEANNDDVTYAALAEMSYMDKCVNETLRKYPPFSGVFRRCTATYTVPGSSLVIDKGTSVIIPALAIQHDPEIYPNPDRFDPERFSPENKAKRHHFAWLPFGEGPRVCIGLRFGIMQIKLALTVLLKRYRFSLGSKTKVPLMMDPKNFVLSVSDGIWLTVEKI